MQSSIIAGVRGQFTGLAAGASTRLLATGDWLLFQNLTNL